MSALRSLNLKVSFPAVRSRARPALADPERKSPLAMFDMAISALEKSAERALTLARVVAFSSAPSHDPCRASPNARHVIVNKSEQSK